MNFMENNKQQTAVEWLADRLPHDVKSFMYNRIQQAKQMEKDQHSDTFNQGVQWMHDHRDLVNGGTEYWDIKPSYFLEYYNETYGKE